MENDEVVERLVSSLRPVRRRSILGDLVIFGCVCAVELVLFFGLGAMRADMPAAMEQPSFWWKLTSLGVLAAVGAAVSILSFDPVVSPRRGLHLLAVIVVLCLASGWAIDALQGGGLQEFARRIDWRDGLQCAGKMALLSVPAVIGLGLLMRRGAPTDTVGTSVSVGITAAAWGAFVFVFACPYDDPLYIAVWYAVGCGMITLFSRFALPRLTHW
jgi:hypothetical protein